MEVLVEKKSRVQKGCSRSIPTTSALRAYASALIEKHALRLECSATMDGSEAVLSLVNEDLRYFYLTEIQVRNIALLGAELCQGVGYGTEVAVKLIPEYGALKSLAQIRIRA